MRFRSLVALVLAAVSLGAAAADSSSLLPPRVEKAITARIATGEYPTMVVAVGDGDRSHVYGFGKLANGKAPDADTLFQIGSVTKTFTATLLAEAVERGEVKLDTPVAKLLPGFTFPSRNGKAITLGELAMQDSGLPRLPSNMLHANSSDPYAEYDAAKLKAFLAGYKLPRDPGAKYEYSNLGLGLLGHALARHAGTSYAKLLQLRIFGPLGSPRPAPPSANHSIRTGRSATTNRASPCSLGTSTHWPAAARSTAPVQTCCDTSKPTWAAAKDRCGAR